MLISIRQYATQRGVSHTAINKAVKAGKIPLVKGKIDPEVADAAWSRNRDARQPSRLAEGKREPTAPTAQTASRQRQQDGPTPGSFAHAQMAHETAKAKKAMLDVQRMEGKLIDRAEVESHWTEIGVRIQNAIMGIPARLLNRLPSEWRTELLTVAQDECRRVLVSLSDEIRPDRTAA